MDISIVCSGNSNSINLFTSVFNKAVQKYYSDSSETLDIPAPKGSYNSATVYFILGKYGSQKSYYIQTIRTSSKNIGGSVGVRKLQLKFLSPST